MIYPERFQELCREAAEEEDPARVHKIREELMELLQEEELALLIEERRKTHVSPQYRSHPALPGR